VQVEAQVLARLVLHHEGVVVVEVGAFEREERRGERPDEPALYHVDHPLEADGVEHDAVVVH